MRHKAETRREAHNALSTKALARVLRVSHAGICARVVRCRTSLA